VGRIAADTVWHEDCWAEWQMFMAYLQSARDLMTNVNDAIHLATFRTSTSPIAHGMPRSVAGMARSRFPRREETRHAT
jgi:hypothetical protein